MCELSDKEYIFGKYNIYSISFSTINDRYAKVAIVYNDHRKEYILINRTFRYTEDFLRSIQSLYFLFTSARNGRGNCHGKIV